MPPRRGITLRMLRRQRPRYGSSAKTTSRPRALKLPQELRPKRGRAAQPNVRQIDSGDSRRAVDAHVY